jgi:ribonuclease D
MAAHHAHDIISLMRPTQNNTPSKAETALLAPFVGLTLEDIIVPVSDDEFAAATREILQAAIVGFDTESKPTFAVGEVSTGPHIVQFAMHTKAYIFQLCHAPCRAYLTEILQSNDVQKVGFGLESDRVQIQKKLGLTVNALVDLNTVFRKLGYRRTAGVRAAVAIVLNQKFHKSKRVTTTNWSLHHLSAAQRLYAANDAYAALKVMEVIEKQEGNG